MTKPKKKEKWEEEFKNWRIINSKEEGSDAVGAWEGYYVDDIVEFISTLLSEQKKEIREKIEKMNRNAVHSEFCEYKNKKYKRCARCLINDILKLIRKL